MGDSSDDLKVVRHEDVGDTESLLQFIKEP
jgi:hypothetical protein